MFLVVTEILHELGYISVLSSLKYKENREISFIEFKKVFARESYLEFGEHLKDFFHFF